MNSVTGIKIKTISSLSALALSLAISSCGCGGYTSSIPQQNPPTQESLGGAWEIIFHSDVSPNDYTVLETNLTQVGTRVFAGSPSALVYQAKPKSPPTSSVLLSRFGGRCDSNGNDEVTFDGILESATPTTGTLKFTVTETGVLGAAETTAAGSVNGAEISGNYSTPATCGSPEDHGSFTGRPYSLSFVDGFSGLLNNGADSLSVMVESVANTFNLAFWGTENGASLNLHGTTVGFSVELKGTVAGQPTEWFALYNPGSNTFQIFDSDAKLLGSLTGNP